MKNRQIPAYFPITAPRDDLFKSSILSRYATNNKSDLVLETLSGMAYINQGKSVWKLTLKNITNIIPSANNTQDTSRVNLKAYWYSAPAAKKAGIEINASKNANLFAGMGVILVPGNLRIPVLTANKKNVQFYGLKLIANQEKFLVSSQQCPIVLMEYNYKHNYRKDFLLQEQGGGGFYIEKHQFPHIHIPLEDSSGGYILVGKQHSATSFSFTAFHIPFGYALYTPSGAIHGDGTLIGRYAITVADPKITADTVLIYCQDTLAKVEDLIPN